MIRDTETQLGYESNSLERVRAFTFYNHRLLPFTSINNFQSQFNFFSSLLVFIEFINRFGEKAREPGEPADLVLTQTAFVQEFDEEFILFKRFA